MDWTTMRTEFWETPRDHQPAPPASHATRREGAIVRRPQRTREQLEALEAHRSLLAEARERGVWTEADARTHRALLGEMARDDRLGALSALVTSVNGQQFRIAARIPF